ncbi:AAA family ATPase [Streptomyces sp. NPDC023723]|uniref:AAA family ATPase n=1 Tax=Streptomyces sp. NPDC023723 TaxID=3154323 RepID=UPI0033D30C9F
MPCADRRRSLAADGPGFRTRCRQNAPALPAGRLAGALWAGGERLLGSGRIAYGGVVSGTGNEAISRTAETRGATSATGSHVHGTYCLVRPGASGGGPHGLAGRDAERDPAAHRVDALVDALPERGGALLLSGEPGIGKSALLRHTAARCEGAARVLWARGARAEAVLPYAVLAEVLLPLRRHFAGLPPVQRHAVEGSLALTEPAGPHPYAVCAGALGVLAAAGAQRPLLVLVDDLHWADPASRQVLQFVARRLAALRVALVLATPSGTDQDGLRESVPHTVLGPLTDDGCWAVLGRHGLDRADPAADRIVRLAGGNPLVLVEYATALVRVRAGGAEPRDDFWETPGPLVARAWQGRLRALPPRSLEALVYVAAGRTPRWSSLRRALAAGGLTTADLDAAEAAGLVRVRDGGCELRHPVLRPVVLGQCATVRRLAVYRRLAAVSSGELRTWYLAAAAPGPDESVAVRLVADARRARQDGAPAAAARAWHRAAELSADPEDTAHRLFEAARDAFAGGTARDAARWCEQALATTRDPLLTADVELLRGRTRTCLGDPARAHQSLADAARAVARADRTRAGRLYGAAAVAAAMDGRIRDVCELAARCVELAGDSTRHPDRPAREMGPVRTHATVAQARAHLLGGDVRAGRAALLALLERAAGPAGPDLADRQAATELGQGLAWTGDGALARGVLDPVIEGLRRDGSPALLPYALLARCEAEIWSRWPAARADAAEALRRARESGQLALTGYALLHLARLAALRGDGPDCRQRVAGYEHGCGGRLRGLTLLARGALGTCALAAGDPDTARAQLDPAFALAHESGLVNPVLMPWVADLAEARLRTGDRAGAVGVADWLRERARATGLAWPAAAHARCRVLLARSAEEAGDWLAVAEGVHSGREPGYERARTLLAAGEVLRRFRRPSAAREPLLLAERTFTALGAAPWALRARGEAAATGHRAVHGDAPLPLTRLTPQELQVARAIGEGLSNGEAAASLFLSRKTIESHLTRVYRKLGVRSRSDLARCLARAGVTG